MDYFIKKQYETQDRNKLDKEIREWADKNINQIIVPDNLSEAFMKQLGLKVNELNAKHANVKKKLLLSIRSRNSENQINISFSECLQYAGYAILNKYIPF